MKVQNETIIESQTPALKTYFWLPSSWVFFQLQNVPESVYKQDKISQILAQISSEKVDVFEGLKTSIVSQSLRHFTENVWWLKDPKLSLCVSVSTYL